jgi:hypothetical protein
MRRILLAVAMVASVVSVSLGMTSAFAGGQGRLQLYLNNSGPSTIFFKFTPPCNGYFKPAELKTTKGVALQEDDPSGAQFPPSAFPYTVPADGGFTVPANLNASILKLWVYSGPGSCPGQTVDQIMFWRVDCSGATCGNVSLTGGWQSFIIPAGTPPNSLFNEHAANAAPVTVGAGDKITLQLSTPSYPAMQWSAPNGPGVSSVNILTSP